MKFRRDIAVFMRKADAAEIKWEKLPIKNALVTKTVASNSNISAKGLVPNSTVVVRFPPQPGLTLAPGDAIYIGGTEEASPPPSSHPVLSVTGGDRGSRSLRLIKAVCG